MITVEKIKMYERYGGDVDSFGRVSTNKEKKIITDDEFTEIERLIQDIKLVERKLTSEEYALVVQQNLRTQCENDEVIAYLKIIAMR